MRKHTTSLLFSLLVGVSAPGRQSNIVFFLADDLGWTDLGCYGSTYHETPHIDGLARTGLRFTNAYAASPLCSPTRASILTGLSPARIGITAPVCHLKDVVLEKGLASAGGKLTPARSVTRLGTGYYTLGEALKDGGYTTAHIGKWHLGPEPYSPFEHGFDVDVPHSPAPSPLHYGFLAPWPVWPGEGEKGDHLEDRMAEEAARFIEANKAKPFVLNFWLWSVHSPWQAKPELIEEYKRKADPDCPQRHAVYAAMCKTMDDAVGVVLRTIESAGLADSTIVVFASDNGPWVVPNRDASVMPPEFHDVPVSSTTPLRGGKAEIYEGGTRVPLIVRWPSVTRPNSTTDAMCLTTDFYPTFLDMLGIKPKPGLAFDGISQVPVLRGGKAVRDEVFAHFPHGVGHLPGFKPSSSLRKGDWKLIRFYGDAPDGSDRLELYNLEMDIGESRNLARAKPERVRALRARLDALLLDAEAVIPKTNPKWRALPQPNKGTEIEIENGALRIATQVKDAYVVWHDVPPKTRGGYVVELRMRSTFGGMGQVFWGSDKHPSFVGQSVDFSQQGDGQWRNYSVRIPETASLRALRLDPGTTTGEAHLAWLLLKSANGKTIKTWHYAKQ